MKRYIINLYHYINDYLKKIIFKEKTFKVSFFINLKMIIKGFKSDDYILYDLDKNDIREYITEIERWKTRRINGKYNICLDDKYVFYEMFKNYVKIPENLFIIKDKKYINFNNEELEKQHILNIIRKYKNIVIKPHVGGGGKGIFELRYEKEKFYLDDKEVEETEIFDKLNACDNSIAVEFVNQASYAEKIYSKTTNTIRIITIYDTNRCYIPFAIHRFGTKQSIPVDNFCKRGLAAKIDIETGELSYAKSKFSKEIYIKHPDSNEQIKGVVVPNWNQIKNHIIGVAKRFPYIKYISWDVLPTEKGFTIIEANASSDLDIIQIFGGIRNSELGKFLKENKIIK